MRKISHLYFSMLDYKKSEEIRLKVKKRSWIIYSFIKSEATREKIIREMINYPGTDEGFYNAQYYANIDLFERYIEVQQRPEKKLSLQKELDDATAVIVTPGAQTLVDQSSLWEQSATEITSLSARLKKLEVLLKAHNIMTVNERLAMMNDDDFLSWQERVWKMIQHLFWKVVSFFKKNFKKK